MTDHEQPEYRTTDGGHPCPHPDMTDEMLFDFEVDIGVPVELRQWPTFDSFLASRPIA